MNLVRKQTPDSWFPSLVNDWLQHDLYLSPSTTTMQQPAVNIQETDKVFIMELAVPGFDKKELAVTVENDILSIASEVESNAKADSRYTRREYSYSAFRRTFTIPENVNSKKIDAHYTDGVLTITLPKKEVTVQDKRENIRIR